MIEDFLPEGQKVVAFSIFPARYDGFYEIDVQAVELSGRVRHRYIALATCERTVSKFTEYKGVFNA